MTTTFIGAATGTLNFSGDSDWFGISLTAGTQYVFNLGNGTLSDPQITIYNSAGQIVYSGSGGGNGGPGSENSQIAFDPTSSGTYYIAASSASGQNTGTFALTASTATYDFAGNVNTTGSLAIGSSVAGTISTAGQNDFFKVTLAAGTTYDFNVSGALTSQLVTVYDSSGHALQAGTDFETGSGGQVMFTATSAGTYYIGVSGQNTGTGAFTLTSSTPTVDFGDTPSTAGSVTVGGTVTGNLTHVQQRDWFGVTLTAGTQYTFSTSGGTLGSNATVALYDANGNNLVSQISGGTTNGAERSFTPTTTGTYYVEAGALLGATGTFNVSVTAIGTEADAGNINTQGVISTTSHATGTLSTPGDSNWFKATLNAGTTYAFNMTDGTLSGAQISLYDSTGKLITTYGASGSGDAEIVFTAPAAGTYYIGAAGQLANTGSYTITESIVTPDVIGNINTTGHVAVGGSVSGTLATPGQNDWYKVTLTAGSQYVFNLSGALSTNGGDITLYDANGNQIATGSTQTSYLAATSGTYFVGASSGSETTGAFTIGVATATDTYPPSTSTTGIFTSVAAEIAAYQAGTLTTANAISDSLANVAANIDNLEQVVAAGKLTSITLTDDQISSTPVLTLSAAQFSNDYQVLSVLKGTYTLDITGFDAAAVQFVQNAQGAGVRYLPGANPTSSHDQVIEVSSITAGASAVTFGSGFNAVLIAGSHSTTASTSGADSFSFAVDNNGVITLHDNNTGQNETITGANYLIFQDGASNVDRSFQSIYFVEGATNSLVTSLYNAAFLRQPDLLGLEYQSVAAGTTNAQLVQVANNFVNSPEFLADYPTAAAAPDAGGAHDQAYITTLYNNILHRAPSAGEVAYYADELAAGTTDRGTILLNFAESAENQAPISDFLVNTSNGAYADSNTLLSPSVILPEITNGSALATGALSSVTTSLTINGITLDPTGTVTLGATAPVETVYLSPTYANIVVDNTGSTVFDGTANSTITVNAANTTLHLGGGGNDSINLLGGTNTTIIAFAPGAGTGLNVANSTNANSVQVLDGTTTPVANLDFTSGNNYVVYVGNVGTGSAAEVATAANKAYTVSDFSGTTTAGEHVTFIGETSSGNAVVYFFGSTAGISNGIVPTASLVHTADTNGNHQVDATEITLIATILGVQANVLTQNDLA